jgi:tRNA threonylcarbamoyladenosine biosynthesis protein TsaB
MATDIPVVGVNTLSAFAAPLLGQSSDKWIASVIDARHSHVYLQLMGSDGKLALPPQIISIDDAIVAIGSKPFRIVGSAATLLGTALSEAGQSPEVAPDRAGADIDWIARLGAIANPEFAPPSPLYLRPPDALPQTNGRIARALF